MSEASRGQGLHPGPPASISRAPREVGGRCSNVPETQLDFVTTAGECRGAHTRQDPHRLGADVGPTLADSGVS